MNEQAKANALPEELFKYGGAKLTIRESEITQRAQIIVG